jgi:hypothetical protein
LLIHSFIQAFFLTLVQLNPNFFLCKQFQAQLQSGLPQNDMVDGPGPLPVEQDEVGAALADLQSSLEGTAISSHGDITHIPELADYIKFFK